MVSLRGTLAVVLKRALKLFGISPPPNVMEAQRPQLPVRVCTYRDVLQMVYRVEGPSRMKQFVVPEVKLCKKVASPQHEYLFVKVQSSMKAAESFYIAIYRYDQGKPPAPVESPERAAQSTPSTPVSEFASASSTAAGNLAVVSSSAASDAAYDSHFHRCAADDRLVRITNRDRYIYDTKYKVYRTLRFNAANPLFLYELLVLAVAVHEAPPDYLLTIEQSYFYAGSILDVLQRICPGVSVRVNTTGSAEVDKEHNVDKRRFIFRKDGSFLGIPIYAGISSSKVDKLEMKYNDDKKWFISQVELPERQRQEVARVSAMKDQAIAEIKQATAEIKQATAEINQATLVQKNKLAQEYNNIVRERNELARKIAEFESQVAVQREMPLSES